MHVLLLYVCIVVLTLSTNKIICFDSLDQSKYLVLLIALIYKIYVCMYVCMYVRSLCVCVRIMRACKNMRMRMYGLVWGRR